MCGSDYQGMLEWGKKAYKTHCCELWLLFPVVQVNVQDCDTWQTCAKTHQKVYQ